MDEVLRYVVLPFCAKTSDSTRPMMTLPEHTSLESTEKNVMRIDAVHSSDMSTVLTLDRGYNA